MLNTHQNALGNQPRIVVVGSSNTDMVVRAPRLPGPGETVLGGTFSIVAGGKGANQAVAAARLGAGVAFIAKVGIDSFGDAAIAGYRAEKIDTRFVFRDAAFPTGVALIGVDESRGENAILVAPGANGQLSTADIKKASESIATADVLICQLEVSLACVETALRIARDAGVLTVLNPAPAFPLSAELLSLVSVLTPNETEAALLVGELNASPQRCAQVLRSKGVQRVVITLGAAGALIADDSGITTVAGHRVANVVDTTAAGDCFTAALAVALAERACLKDAATFANAAAAISVTRAGAQPSLPTRMQVGEIHII